MQHIIFDIKSLIEFYNNAEITKEWFSEFVIPKNNLGIVSTEYFGNIYIANENNSKNTNYLVVSKDIFSNSENNIIEIFNRIIRVSLKNFDRAITIPMTWGPYQEGSILSIYSSNRGSDERIYFDSNPLSKNNIIYAYEITKKPESNSEVKYNSELISKCIANIDDAIISYLENKRPEDIDSKNSGIFLIESLSSPRSGVFSYQEWIDKLLNKEQKDFVDLPIDKPARLKGSAGTGKTQAMLIKLVKEYFFFTKKSEERKICYITHSSALAHSVIKPEIEQLVSKSFNEINSGKTTIWVGTLYEYAQEILGYREKGLRPLSTDGLEGKELQHLLISDAIDITLNDLRVQSQLKEKTRTIWEKISSKDENVIANISHEFSSSLDPLNITRGNEAYQKYIESKRNNWQLALDPKEERILIFEIYENYRYLLTKNNYLSMDQIIIDLDNYLKGHGWRNLRTKSGFDLIFIDEYHYFTKNEVFSMQNIFKSNYEENKNYPIFMAYDIKQKTNEKNIEDIKKPFYNNGIGATTIKELKQVYRSTDKITKLLNFIDQCFPVFDLDENILEDKQVNYSEKDSDAVPKIRVFAENIELLDETFKLATAYCKNHGVKNSEVAILCLNDDLFNKYSIAGRVSDFHIPIKSREDIEHIRYHKRKFIFSTPDYVAGLQFEKVYIINLDNIDLKESLTNLETRRYLAKLYLGCSRAKNELEIFSSNERGGLPDFLNNAIRNKIIEQI